MNPCKPIAGAALALLALIAIAIAGCGEGEGEAGERTVVTVPATTTTEPTPAESTTTEPTTTESTTTEPTGTAESALGSTETTIAGVPVEVEVTELTRADELATLNVAITNLSSRDSDVFYQELDDSGHGTAADGLVLIDPASGQEYRVVRNPGEGCLCSDELPFTLRGHQEIRVYASFDAPPPTASALNVSFPGSVGTITGVPIS